MLTAIINKKQLLQNMASIKSIVRTKLCLVVKADAYGHGAVEVANILKSEVDEFAVANFDEAIELLAGGISKPINILGGAITIDYGQNMPKLRDIINKTYSMSHIIPTICDKADIEIIKNCNVGFKYVNVKINTGMNRLGIDCDEFTSVCNSIIASGLKVKSVFSHFYDTDNLSKVTEQKELFDDVASKVEKKVDTHIGASNILELGSDYNCDMIRLGLSVYGYSRVTKPILSVYSHIVKIFNVSKGDNVSYGNYVAKKDMRLAVVFGGYADGIRRKEREQDEGRYVAINGILCDIVGQVCMDMVMVDITNANINFDDKAYFLGGGVTAESLAREYKTNIYETLTSFKGRIRKKYE